MPATAQIKIAADTVQFRNSMREVEKSMNKLGSITKRTQSTLSGVFKTMGKTSALGLFVGLPSTLVASQRSFQKFEKQILEVFTLLPNANRAMLQKLKNDAIGFSMDYGISKEEAAMGMYQSISAGQSPTGLTEGFMKVAQESAIAGVTDLKTAVDALTNVINSYGEGMYDVGYVADRMFHAVSMSKTTFRELADYMYQIIPTAAAMKVRFDDLMGSISAMAATGTLTRVGTTQLRQFLIELGREGDKSNLAFLQGSGGVPIQKFIKEGGRLTEVIHIMGEVARKRRTDLRNLFGSVEAGNAALTLYNSKAYKGMVKALQEDADGAMSVAFKKIMGSQEKRLDRVKEAFMSVFTRLGEVIKPMIDDILTYFEGVADQIRNYKWSKLADNFNTAWYKIKTAVQDGKFWDIFSTGANLAFTKIKFFIEDLVKPAINKVTNMMALLFDPSKDFNIGDGLLNSLKGVGSYLLSIAKDFGIELLDAFRSPLAFMASGLESAVNNMFEAFIDKIPQKAKDLLGIKTMEERQNLEAGKIYASHVPDAAEKMNKAIYGKDYYNLMEERAGYVKDLEDLNNGANPRRLSPEQMDEKYGKYKDRFGHIKEYDLSPEVLKEYRLDRGHYLTHRNSIQDKIDELDKKAKASIVAPDLAMDHVFYDDKTYGYQIAGGKPIEYQYKAATGKDLLEGVDEVSFKRGDIGKDYETVIQRLQSAVDNADRSFFGVSELYPLEEFKEYLEERRDKIIDNAFKVGAIDSTKVKEANFNQKYKDYSNRIQFFANELRQIQNKTREDDKKEALERTVLGFNQFSDGFNKLEKEAENLQTLLPTTAPSGSVESKDEFGLPIMTLPVDELGLKVEELKEKLSKMVTDLGMPEPLPKEKDADEGKSLYEVSKEEPKPFEVAPKIPDVKGDNMTKMGGGGGFFSYKFKPIDRNTEAIDRSREAMDELRDAIKKRTMKGERILLDTILPQVPLNTPQHIIDSEINDQVDSETIREVHKEMKSEIVDKKENKHVVDYKENKHEQEYLKKVENSTMLNVFRDMQSKSVFEEENSKEKNSSSVNNVTEENVDKKIVPPTPLQIEMREKLKNDPEYKYSDEHFRDAWKNRKQSASITNQESESNSVKETPYIKPLINLSSIINEKNVSKESVKETEKTSQTNRVFNESNANNKNNLSENYKSFKSNIFNKTSEESQRNVFNQSNSIQPKFSKVGFESPSQQQGGLNGGEMVKMLNDSAGSLQRAANRLEKLTPSVDNIEPINFA